MPARAGLRPPLVAAAILALAAALGLIATPRVSSPRPVNDHLPWHAARLDGQGRLEAWYRPEQGLGYDHVLRAGWSFIERRVPEERTGGGKVYLTYAVLDDRTRQGTYWQHDPAGLYASFVDALLPWYAYSGDRRAIGAVRRMLDYQLAHGTTPAGWSWPRVPFPTSCGGSRNYGRCLAGMPRTYYGGIEPDKVALLGLGYARFYELTGERRFLRAAVRCGEALAVHVRAGDASHTPWPFRVDARTGTTLERSGYGGMVVAAVWLLDELDRLRAGPAASFAHARRVAWQWLVRYPLNPRSAASNGWSGHYEDIDYDPSDVNQAIPTMTALYLLSRPSPARVDPHWRAHVHRLLEWVRTQLGRGPFHGAWAIDEQRSRQSGFACCSRAGLGSDTARWAAAEALYAERTGSPTDRAAARSSLAYATYFMRSDGVVSCCGDDLQQTWFSDGYADYLKSFSWALGALPQLAPPGENHILRSTSVVQRVAYRADAVAYRTYSADAVELLRLRSRPARVLAGGRPLARRGSLAGPGYGIRSLGHGDFVITIRHDRARDVLIRLAPG